MLSAPLVAFRMAVCTLLTESLGVSFASVLAALSPNTSSAAPPV
jgi:hypothetical protein